MLLRILIVVFSSAAAAFSQVPAIEPGVSQELAKWRSSQYSNISYKLNLTLEKMSPVLKGTIEIHVTQAATACAEPNCPPMAIILDWRRIPGHEKDSAISNVTLNGEAVAIRSEPPALVGGTNAAAKSVSATGSQRGTNSTAMPPAYAGGSDFNDHLVFRDGVKMAENVIKLDFTSPILTSGSAITRYVDKEDGAEYIYSLFVPSDASAAFPVFDQPDLKARFSLTVTAPRDWNVVSNTLVNVLDSPLLITKLSQIYPYDVAFYETKPISTYVFAFAAGSFEAFGSVDASGMDRRTSVYVRRSQAERFKSHSNEVFRLNREAVKYLETYFDYKFPWPKYDLVLIPEFPFGGMEHAGATFIREDRVIFPAEPTANDYITRANVIFHEAAHQWFGDCVTMRWFDDLWLKEGFAEFMAYKTLEHVMPEYNAWQVFYERNKQAAYATDSTRGTTPIYQEIRNLSAAKSAYGNIVYRKAPSFLRQAEFFLGEKEFQKAVRNFLKKNEFKNAEWKDLVDAFEKASKMELKAWAETWVKRRGLPVIRVEYTGARIFAMSNIGCEVSTFLNGKFASVPDPDGIWLQKTKILTIYNVAGLKGRETRTLIETAPLNEAIRTGALADQPSDVNLIFPNYQDYGYGIFLLDDKSRDYVLKNIQNEEDPFLRSMMWGALWDSVREAELDPREYVELVIKTLGGEPLQKPARSKGAPGVEGTPETDETTIQSLLGRVSTALNYYVSAPSTALTNVRGFATDELHLRFEAMLLDRLQNASTAGQRVTYFRAFVNNATTERSRDALKQMLTVTDTKGGNLSGSEGAGRDYASKGTLPTGRVSALNATLRSKDKFDIVTRLAILGDADAMRLLAGLEKTETGDDARRYAYAAHAAFPTPENKARFFNDFLSNNDISESWIESAIFPFNSIRHADLTQQYLTPALAELPNLKRRRKIFFVGDWLGAFIGGQRDQKPLEIINKFLADNPNLDNDLRLKILENADVIERAVKIRGKYSK